jgi:hypothetical protein
MSSPEHQLDLFIHDSSNFDATRNRDLWELESQETRRRNSEAPGLKQVATEIVAEEVKVATLPSGYLD